MPPVIWDPSFAVGHGEVDRQHKEFLDIMNEMECLLAASPLAYNRSARLEILEKIQQFSGSHFSLEHQLMREHAYPETDACNHWRGHKSFDAGIYTLYRELRAGKFVFDSTILSLLREKFFVHILREDKMMFQHLFSGPRQQGRQECCFMQKTPVPFALL